MKRRIQDSQKSALLKAKELRFGKAMDVAIEARKQAKRKGAKRADQVNFAMKNLRAIERSVEMLDAKIARGEEVLKHAEEKGKKSAIIKIKGNIAQASKEKAQLEKESKKAKEALSAELKKS